MIFRAAFLLLLAVLVGCGPPSRKEAAKQIIKPSDSDEFRRIVDAAIQCDVEMVETNEGIISIELASLKTRRCFGAWRAAEWERRNPLQAWLWRTFA